MESVLLEGGIGSGLYDAAFSFWADCGKVWWNGGKFSTDNFNYLSLEKSWTVENFVELE